MCLEDLVGPAAGACAAEPCGWWAREAGGAQSSSVWHCGDGVVVTAGPGVGYHRSAAIRVWWSGFFSESLDSAGLDGVVLGSVIRHSPELGASQTLCSRGGWVSHRSLSFFPSLYAGLGLSPELWGSGT